MLASLVPSRGDLFGGISAGIVALPLCLAFGAISGLGPEAGLYGAIAAGILAAVFDARVRNVERDLWRCAERTREISLPRCSDRSAGGIGQMRYQARFRS